MITTLHVATGAATGALLRSRVAALAAGPLLHIAGDVVPHRDIPSKGFETVSGVAALLLVAAARGPFSPEAIGAAAASAPDLEHALPLPKPGGRDLFPSHRIPGLHREGGLPAAAQLVAAGLLLALVTRRRRR